MLMNKGYNILRPYKKDPELVRTKERQFEIELKSQHLAQQRLGWEPMPFDVTQKGKKIDGKT